MLARDSVRKLRAAALGPPSGAEPAQSQPRGSGQPVAQDQLHIFQRFRLWLLGASLVILVFRSDAPTILTGLGVSREAEDGQADGLDEVLGLPLRWTCVHRAPSRKLRGVATGRRAIRPRP